MSFSYLHSERSYDARYNWGGASLRARHWLFIVLSIVAVAVLSVSISSGTEANVQIPASSQVHAAAADQEDSQSTMPAVPAENLLQEELGHWVSQQKKSTWGIYVRPLDGRQVTEVNADAEFELASIYKLFLLDPLAQQLPSNSWSDEEINGKTYKECVSIMLSRSDNPCAEAIFQQLGWSFVHKQTEARGYENTFFNKKEYFAGTAADTGLLLERLYKIQGFDSLTRQLALDAMVQTKWSEGIRQGCEGCTVYNKTGEYNGKKHDAAIIEKNGQAYVLVVMSDSGSWQQITQVSQIVNNHL